MFMKNREGGMTRKGKEKGQKWRRYQIKKEERKRRKEKIKGKEDRGISEQRERK